LRLVKRRERVYLLDVMNLFCSFPLVLVLPGIAVQIPPDTKSDVQKTEQAVPAEQTQPPELPPPPGLLPLQVKAEISPADRPRTPVLLTEDRLVVVSRGSQAECFDLQTGELQWRLGLPGRDLLAPRLLPEGILLASGDGKLFIVDSETGSVSRELTAPTALVLPPLPVGSTYLLSTPEGDVIAFDPVKEREFWRAVTGEAPLALAQGGELVVVSGAKGSLTALEARSGQVRWKFRGRGGFEAPAAFDITAERLYIGDRSGAFYSLSADEGKVRFRWETGAAIVTPALVDSDRVYVTSYATTLFAYRAGNGHEQWRLDLPGRPASGPVKVNQHILVATRDGYVVEVVPLLGQQGTTPYKAPTDIRSQPSFRPPFAVLTLRTGRVLLLETTPPEPPPTEVPADAAPAVKKTEIRF